MSGKVVTIYAEKYHKRKAAVMGYQAAALVAEASAIYCDEQGEIEIPSLDKQRRVFSVLRIERIISDDAAAPPHAPKEAK